MIDWNVVAIIAAPTIALFIGAALNRALERRVRLTAYYGHVSSFTVRKENPFPVFTHSIVIRNVGRKTANNVRLGHNTLPDYQIFPSIEYSEVKLAGGGKEILIPTLVPGEQITISYLYFPPIVWKDINTYIKSDEGFAKRIEVLLTPVQPKWVKAVVGILLLIGLIASVYLIVLFIKWIIGQ